MYILIEGVEKLVRYMAIDILHTIDQISLHNEPCLWNRAVYLQDAGFTFSFAQKNYQSNRKRT